MAAGYALYGSACMVVLTTGDGVNGFTLDPVSILVMSQKVLEGITFVAH